MAELMRSIGVALVLILTACASPVDSPPAPESPESPVSSPEPPPSGTGEISRDEAVDLAREELRHIADGWVLVLAEAGRNGEIRPRSEGFEWAGGLSAGDPVWRVVMAAGNLSAEVVIDFVDGSVYSSTVGIAN